MVELSGNAESMVFNPLEGEYEDDQGPPTQRHAIVEDGSPQCISMNSRARR